MKKLAVIAAAALTAGPAFAATGSFFSLGNTNFIVLISFLVFVGVLLYFKVPARVGALLDSRAAGIRRDLDEAKRLREEAQEIYASYERRQRDVAGQADQIVANAKREAEGQAAKRVVDGSIAQIHALVSDIRSSGVSLDSLQQDVASIQMVNVLFVSKE